MLEAALYGLANVLKSISWIFRQTYTNDILWDRDESVEFWGQGQGGITYAGTITVHTEHTVLDVSCRIRLSSFSYIFIFIFIFIIRPIKSSPPTVHKKSPSGGPGLKK